MKIYNNHDGSTGKISTSKGNQIKMCVDHTWYKMDFLGYEGLAEYASSLLLGGTNMEDYVTYEMTEIELNEQTFNGCKSHDFLEKNEEIVTADKLFRNFTGKSSEEYIGAQKDLKARIALFVDKVEEFTGLTDYGAYLTKMLEWDGFILNDDRHFNNIAFTYNQKTHAFRICPLFDNGAAFLSDTRFDYPLEKSIYGLMADVQAKPFDVSFDKQIAACEALYGVWLQIDKDMQFTADEVNHMKACYGDRITERVCSVFEHQKGMSDYLYDFSREIGMRER